MKRIDRIKGAKLPRPSLEQLLSSLLLLFLISSCSKPAPDGKDTASSKKGRATRFELLERPYGHLLRLLNKKGKLGTRYQLIDKGKKPPDTLSSATRIRTPINRIACLSAPHAGMLLELNAEERIAAFPSKTYLYDKSLRERMENGDIESIGMQRSIDTERLVALDVGLLLDDGMSGGSGGNEKVLRQAGIPTLDILAWKEKHPLGRLEWIRVFGALTGKEAMADSIHHERSLEYDSLKTELEEIEEPPEVLCNAPHKGTWHIPGGKSYMARLIRDAGAAHPWPGNESSGGVPKSLEEVIAKAGDAEFWINPGAANSLEGLASVDARIDRFKAFEEKKVYNNDARVTASGGNDFWESGPLHPELILSDLIRIFHPELDQAGELHYYRKLPRTPNP